MTDPATLEFYYGTVNSAKTLTMLARAHAWTSTGKSVCIIKPEMDSRSHGVSSRVGLSAEADIVIGREQSLKQYWNLIDGTDLVLVDEVQFLSREQVMELRLLSIGRLIKTLRPIPVQCFGLRTLSDGSLWDSISVLMAQADALHEVSTVCAFCSRPAVFSKSVEGGSVAGVNITWDGFVPVCAYHFHSGRDF